MILYNSLTRTKEEFVAIEGKRVGMYTCGQTVYGYTHIGHGRKYVNDDVLRRALTWLGYEVKHVQNVTDVGHLVSDADEGEDKMEKGARAMGKTAWEVAEYFTDQFYTSLDKLNVLRPDVVCKATEHIPEQIEMVKTLMDKGFAYDTPEAVYFDISKFADYGKLFGQKIEDKKVGVREKVKIDENKKNPADFALWVKRVGEHANHTMHWESPWGDGFPGWHIECSAMSIKYLGEQFDIHTGGKDHLPVHHPNEIAQSEAATGKHPFVKYWVHYNFLLIEGQKMSSSLGNLIRVEDVENVSEQVANLLRRNTGFDPIALRYLYLTGHYRKEMNFTWESLGAAEKALKKLKRFIEDHKITRSLDYGESESNRTALSEEKLAKVSNWQMRFRERVEDDLDMPGAVAGMWEMLKDNIPEYDKVDLLLDWDQVLGLRLGQLTTDNSQLTMPKEVEELVEKREELRKEKKWDDADELRKRIEEMGYRVEDKGTGYEIKKIEN